MGAEIWLYCFEWNLNTDSYRFQQLVSAVCQMDFDFVIF